MALGVGAVYRSIIVCLLGWITLVEQYDSTRRARRRDSEKFYVVTWNMPILALPRQAPGMARCSWLHV